MAFRSSPVDSTFRERTGSKFNWDRNRLESKVPQVYQWLNFLIGDLSARWNDSLVNPLLNDIELKGGAIVVYNNLNGLLEKVKSENRQSVITILDQALVPSADKIRQIAQSRKNNSPIIIIWEPRFLTPQFVFPFRTWCILANRDMRTMLVPKIRELMWQKIKQ